MSSQDLTTAKYLPACQESAEMPDCEAKLTSAFSFEFFRPGMGTVLVLILVACGGVWCYSTLNAMGKAAEAQQAAKELSVFDVVSCVFGSDRGKAKIEKSIGQMQEDRIAEMQREFQTPESLEMQRRLQDIPGQMEQLRQQAVQQQFSHASQGH